MDFMLMATTAFLMVTLIYLSNFFEDAHMRSSRETAVLKFRENREKSMRFYKSVEEYVTEYNVWGYNAFEDTDVTFAEFIEVLKEKHNIEYSNLEESKLAKSRMTRSQMEDCLERMEYQQEFIAAMHATLLYKNEGFEKQAIA